MILVTTNSRARMPIDLTVNSGSPTKANVSIPQMYLLRIPENGIIMTTRKMTSSMTQAVLPLIPCPSYTLSSIADTSGFSSL